MMLSLLAALALIGSTLACSHLRVHFQTTYCSSSVIAKIKIDSLSNENETSGEKWMTEPYFEYQGTILGIRKGNGYEEGKNVIVRTVAQTSMCGPKRFTVGETYMIFGNSSDDGAIDADVYNGYKLVSNEEQYKKMTDIFYLFDTAVGCDCKVDMQGFSPMESSDTCYVGSLSDCEFENGVCAKQNNQCVYLSYCPEH